MTPESITHRELRNESGRILRAVAEGESFVVTNNGVGVARIVPLEASAAREARSKAGTRRRFRDIEPCDIDHPESAAEVLDYLRGDR